MSVPYLFTYYTNSFVFHRRTPSGQDEFAHFSSINLVCIVSFRFYRGMATVADFIKHVERVLEKLKISGTGRATPLETTRTRIVSVLVWYLSTSPLLAKVYASSRGSTSLDAHNDADDTHCVLTMSSWLQEYDSKISAALRDIENPERIRADAFLVRSLVGQFLSLQNSKGISVSSREAIDMYLMLWTTRPVSEQYKDYLVKLTHHVNTRRKFIQTLKREWMLDFGEYSLPPSVSEAEGNIRALR